MVDDWCPEGWMQVKLADLGEVSRGRSRHRPRYAEHLYGGAYPFIQTGDIKASGGKITTYQQTYSKAGLAQSRLWSAGTMCITIAANIAETAILTFPACFPDSVVGFVPDDSKCDVYFVEYMFRHLKRKIQHEATGSVQDNINLGTLDKLCFPIPSLSEQKAIARILSSLDDKIELNQQMNRTLEAQARAIFKSWFVDFDPVRAKMEGRQPAGMDAETAVLFPDAFEESELGMIPKGWKVGTIDFSRN
jgi:type I restriction enzyme, S subunit